MNLWGFVRGKGWARVALWVAGCIGGLAVTGCTRDWAFQSAFRELHLGDATGKPGMVQWYDGPDASQQVIVLWGTDPEAKIDRKMLLRLVMAGAGSPGFSGEPDLMTASDRFLMMLPASIVCLFEGYVVGDQSSLRQWAGNPGPLLAEVFPRGEESLKHFPPGPAQMVPQSGTGQNEPAALATSVLILEESPSSGLRIQAEVQPQGTIHLRGFAFAPWPSATVLVGSGYQEIPDTCVGSLLGWSWMQGEWRAHRKTDLAWERYVDIRDAFVHFARSYESTVLERTPQEARSPQPPLSTQIWLWRSYMKIMRDALRHPD